MYLLSCCSMRGRSLRVITIISVSIFVSLVSASFASAIPVSVFTSLRQDERVHPADPRYTETLSVGDIGVLPDGRVIATDRLRHRIVEITADGEHVSIIAGTGNRGNHIDPNSPLNTEFSTPRGIEVAHNGDILVADTGNCRVLRITEDRQHVRVVAGSGRMGIAFDPNSPRQTDLNEPEGIFMVRNGAILISDALDSRVFEISPDEMAIARIAGVGIGGTRDFDPQNPTASNIACPSPINSLPNGQVIVAGTSRVFLFSLHKDRIDIIVGTDQTGNRLDVENPRNTQLKSPEGLVALWNGRLVISDTGNHRVLITTPNRERITTLIGTGQRGETFDAYNPQNTAIHPGGIKELPDGRVLVSDGPRLLAVEV